MNSSNKPKKARKSYDLAYKGTIVQEYLSGTATAQEIASREGLVRGQIYRWRVQLDEHAKVERVEQIQADDPLLTLDQARRIRELEERAAQLEKISRPKPQKKFSAVLAKGRGAPAEPTPKEKKLQALPKKGPRPGLVHPGQRQTYGRGEDADDTVVLKG